MVVKVLNCLVKINPRKMAIIVGTALAITAYSACMAPLLHCPENDDDNDSETKKTLARTTEIVHHKPQSSLMTIFLNGLRKIGFIAPSTDNESSPVGKCGPCANMCPCLPPIVPIIEVLKTPRNVPEDLREPAHDSTVHPAKVLEDRNNNTVHQRRSIKLVLSKTSQSTQTGDFDGVRDTTGTEESSTTEESRTSSDQKTSEADSALPADESSITEESKASSAAPPPRSSAAAPQTADKIIKPRISKPPRAHPPRKIVTKAQIHQDASLSNFDRIQHHQESTSNQTASGRPSNHSSRIRTTPKGRFGPHSAHHHCSCVTSHASDMTAVSPTIYFSLPESKSSRRPKTREPEGRISDTPGSLVDKLRKLMTLRQISQSRNCGDGSRDRPDMPAVQTNQSDHSGHVRRVYMAETSRSSSLIQDLENEHHSNADVMSSTRVPHGSSIEEENEVLPEDSGSKRAENTRENGDLLVEKARIFLRDVDRVWWNLDAAREALARSRNAIDQHLEQPSRTPEVLLCDSKPHPRMHVSDGGNDYLERRRKKKGIIWRVKEIFRRPFKKRNQSTLAECDSTFDRNFRWNLLGHSLHFTDL